MDRRRSLKTLLVGSVAAGAMLEACETADKKAIPPKQDTPANDADRMAEEKLHDKALHDQVFFSPEEMATITILADIIIPRDELSGSASEAKVPDFIEFIVKDKPEHQIPMRGGLRWLDLKSLKQFDKPFSNLTTPQQLEIVDLIAYPLKAKPEDKQGSAFFSLMRNLTISGFYTTPMGVQDIGYLGNKPNQWNGVPDDVLKQYGMSYTEKELKECISFDKV
jgi:hypothetical protein